MLTAAEIEHLTGEAPHRMPGMRKRDYATPEGAADFYAKAIADRNFEGKLPLARFSDGARLERIIGRPVDVDEIVAQASYLRHIHDKHGIGGLRRDAHPVVPRDLILAVGVIDSDIAPQLADRTTHAGNLLVVFKREIGGLTYKAICEVRSGRKNRNLAIFNLYKR